jgi:hypothetical protein
MGETAVDLDAPQIEEPVLDCNSCTEDEEGRPNLATEDLGISPVKPDVATWCPEAISHSPVPDKMSEVEFVSEDVATCRSEDGSHIPGPVNIVAVWESVLESAPDSCRGSTS